MFHFCRYSESQNESLDLPSAAAGDVYQGETGLIPDHLDKARTHMMESDMLRTAMGEEVLTHYARCADWEIEEFSRIVTDWEISRGFEKA